MESYQYLIHIQYLGFRYHGWQKQPGVKTVESMMEKTLAYILGHRNFKLLGASRTDAMVSASHSACALFTQQPIDATAFTDLLNRNLPNDIRILETEPVPASFNIIRSPRIKAYVYLFAYGEKPHPFSAPLVCTVPENLDIARMQQGAELFRGCHDFRQYVTKPAPGTRTVRKIRVSRIEKDTAFTAGFFPATTHAYHIHAKGFMRNQIRLIMGQLLRLGKGEIGLARIADSLKGNVKEPLRHIAPASGLILHRIYFDVPLP